MAKKQPPNNQANIRILFAKQARSADASTPAKARGDNSASSAALPATTTTRAAGGNEPTAEQDGMKRQCNIKSYFTKAKGAASGTTPPSKATAGNFTAPTATTAVVTPDIAGDAVSQQSNVNDVHSNDMTSPTKNNENSAQLSIDMEVSTYILCGGLFIVFIISPLFLISNLIFIFIL